MNIENKEGEERITIEICNKGYYLHHEKYSEKYKWEQNRGDILLKDAINGVVED